MSDFENLDLIDDAIANDAETSPDPLAEEALPTEDALESAVQVKPENLITDGAAIEQALEAVIFASPRAITTLRLKNLLTKMNYDTSELKVHLDIIEERFAERGFQLVKVGGGYQFRTHPGQADIVSKMVEDKPVRLSGSALEVLSIVAYKQPITRAEIDAVRGVDSGHLMKGLLEKNLIKMAGHAEAPGRPLLYTTTNYFLEIFSVNSLEDLPSLDEFQREITSQQIENEDPLVLSALDGTSGLAAEPDRGSFDAVRDESVEAPDFGIEDRAHEEMATS